MQKTGDVAQHTTAKRHNDTAPIGPSAHQSIQDTGGR